MIDPQSEKLIALREVPKLRMVPKRRLGSKLAVSTLHRWITRGIKGKKLESLRIGGQVYTSEEALLRFFQGLSSKTSSACQQTQVLRRTHLKEVEEQLDQFGL